VSERTSAEIRRIMRDPVNLTIHEIRAVTYRNRTHLPTAPKGYEIAVLELLEDKDRQIESLEQQLSDLPHEIAELEGT
jgi:hypothetical protein